MRLVLITLELHPQRVLNWCKRSTIAQSKKPQESLLTLGINRYPWPSFLTLLKWKFTRHDV